MSLSQKDLKSVLDYDPETGLFTWKKLTRNRHLEGKVAGHTALCDGYTRISVLRKLYLAHRLVFLFMEGELPQVWVDHINGNRSDNRWSNLRHCTASQNLKNAALSCRSKTGYRGVSYVKKDGKFKAEIQSDFQRYWLGYFDTAEEAAIAYDTAASLYHLEFARPNGVLL